MTRPFLLTTLNQALSWAKANSLWYFHAASGCCADELFNAFGCRYDIERFGCVPQMNPKQADLLVVSGIISKKLAPHLQSLFESMQSPKHVLALGACACSGGIFSAFPNEAVVPGAGELLPIDVFVAGCPPRPEAILHGLMQLQEKIKRAETQ